MIRQRKRSGPIDIPSKANSVRGSSGKIRDIGNSDCDSQRLTQDHRSMIADNVAVRFRYTKWKLVGFLLFSAAMAVNAALILSGVIEGPASGSFKAFILWLGLPLFVGLAVYNLLHLFRSGDVVTISPAGIRDIRIGAETMPWSDIRKLSIMEVEGHRFLMIVMDPRFERTFAVTRVARLKVAGRKGYGPDGHSIHMQGLNGSFDDLLAAVDRFAPALIRPVM